MKKNYTPISRLLTASVMLFLVSALTLLGQTPTTFNYQAVLRNADGTINGDATVAIQLQLHQGTAAGTVVYDEIHNTTTSEFGLVNLEIGSVTPAVFDAIDWSAGPYFLEVTVNGTSMGVSELLTVPYALAAVNSVDSDLLESQDGSFYRNAANLNAGTLNNGRFSAYSDLGAEGYLDNNSGTDLLTRTQADSRYLASQVAFLAYNSTDDLISASGWHDVEFDTEIFDDGGNYNNVTDRFVAPVSGVYHFTAKVGITNSINSIGYVILGFSVNGAANVKLVLEYYPTADSHEVTQNGSFTYKLNAGDYVKIRLYSSPDASYSINNGEYSTTFCGHLVYAY
jgi:hypothetical protein